MMCLRPWVSRTGDQLPCGSCPACRKTRSSIWGVRLLEEDKVAESSHFITLTYANHSVRQTDSGFLTLHKPDLQKFFKRLRKRTIGYSVPVRYYCCGEYGGKTARPHYHAIVYNCSQDDVVMAWMLNGRPIGDVHFGDTTRGSVAYTLKYISKPSRVPMFEGDDRVPEFSLYSKRLGNSYLTPEILAWHRSNPEQRACYVLEGGVKAPLPRSWKDVIFPPSVIDPHHDLRLRVKSYWTDKYRKEEEDLTERLASADEVVAAEAREQFDQKSSARTAMIIRASYLSGQNQKL